MSRNEGSRWDLISVSHEIANALTIRGSRTSDFDRGREPSDRVFLRKQIRIDTQYAGSDESLFVNREPK